RYLVARRRRDNGELRVAAGDRAHVQVRCARVADIECCEAAGSRTRVAKIHIAGDSNERPTCKRFEEDRSHGGGAGNTESGAVARKDAKEEIPDRLHLLIVAENARS